MNWIVSQVALDPIDIISQVGVPVAATLGLVWAFVTGKFHTDSEVQNLKESIKASVDREAVTTKASEIREVRLESQVDALTQQISGVLLPTVHDAISTFKEISKITQQSTDETKKTSDSVKSLQQALELSEARNNRPTQ